MLSFRRFFTGFICHTATACLPTSCIHPPSRLPLPSAPVLFDVVHPDFTCYDLPARHRVAPLVPCMALFHSLPPPICPDSFDSVTAFRPALVACRRRLHLRSASARPRDQPL